jgi:hypothetical protein
MGCRLGISRDLSVAPSGVKSSFALTVADIAISGKAREAVTWMKVRQRLMRRLQKK